MKAFLITYLVLACLSIAWRLVRLAINDYPYENDIATPGRDVIGTILAVGFAVWAWSLL